MALYNYTKDEVSRRGTLSSCTNPFSPRILPAAEDFVLVAKPPVLEVGCTTEAGIVIN
jgi:hypothetical protein